MQALVEVIEETFPRDEVTATALLYVTIALYKAMGFTLSEYATMTGSVWERVRGHTKATS